jgi:hypothetical protein
MRLPAEIVLSSIDRCKTGRDAHMDPLHVRIILLSYEREQAFLMRTPVFVRQDNFRLRPFDSSRIAANIFSRKTISYVTLAKAQWHEICIASHSWAPPLPVPACYTTRGNGIGNTSNNVNASPSNIVSTLIESFLVSGLRGGRIQDLRIRCANDNLAIAAQTYGGASFGLKKLREGSRVVFTKYSRD